MKGGAGANGLKATISQALFRNPRSFMTAVQVPQERGRIRAAAPAAVIAARPWKKFATADWKVGGRREQKLADSRYG